MRSGVLKAKMGELFAKGVAAVGILGALALVALVFVQLNPGFGLQLPAALAGLQAGLPWQAGMALALLALAAALLGGRMARRQRALLHHRRQLRQERQRRVRQYRDARRLEEAP